MGKKSVKGKEKKMKRKEELAKLNASQAAVDLANQAKDPLETLAPFKKFDRNGLNLNIECMKVTQMLPDDVQWAFDLTKKNMENLYNDCSWGWNDKKKKEEMTEENAWYLIAKSGTQQRVAMSHFRFDIDDNDEVLYCYEIHVESQFQGKGLGKFLMQILEMLAHRFKMQKVVLTAFKHNPVAEKFFIGKLNYQIDETDPSLDDPLDADEYCYQILSKPVVSKKATSQ